jgi:hypothetical protein
MATASNEEVDSIKWASVMFEPILGSNERITIALGAINTRGDTRCVNTMNPETVATIFRDERRYVRDVVSLVVDSLNSYIKETRSFGGWVPPVAGAFLGRVNTSLSNDIDALLVRAASMTSVFYVGSYSGESIGTARQSWHQTVNDLLIESDDRLRNHINAKVFLSNHDVPAVFTFLSPSYATNLVTFSARNVKQRIEDARAKAWSLNLLADAPSFLIRPARRELLAGIDASAEEDVSIIKEAIEEVSDEAARRSVIVVRMDSPDAVASRILLRHRQAA